MQRGPGRGPSKGKSKLAGADERDPKRYKSSIMFYMQRESARPQVGPDGAAGAPGWKTNRLRLQRRRPALPRRLTRRRRAPGRAAKSLLVCLATHQVCAERERARVQDGCSRTCHGDTGIATECAL